MDAWLKEILADAERKVEESPPWMRSAEWHEETKKIEDRKEGQGPCEESP